MIDWLQKVLLWLWPEPSARVFRGCDDKYLDCYESTDQSRWCARQTFFSAKKLTFHGNSDLVTREPVGLLVLDDIWPSHQNLQDGKVPDRERRPTILSATLAVDVPKVQHRNLLSPSKGT